MIKIKGLTVNQFEKGYSGKIKLPDDFSFEDFIEFNRQGQEELICLTDREYQELLGQQEMPETPQVDSKGLINTILEAAGQLQRLENVKSTPSGSQNLEPDQFKPHAPDASEAKPTNTATSEDKGLELLSEPRRVGDYHGCKGCEEVSGQSDRGIIFEYGKDCPDSDNCKSTLIFPGDSEELNTGEEDTGE
jgi:hypothetical protein